MGAMAAAPLPSPALKAGSWLISTKEAADSGSSWASTLEYQEERKEPFTYQEAVLGVSSSSTMPLLPPMAAFTESL